MSRTALIFGAIAAALIGLWLWVKGKRRAVVGPRPAPANPSQAANKAATQGIDTISGVIIGGVAKTIGDIFTSQPNSTSWGYTDTSGYDSTGGGSFDETLYNYRFSDV
jgi:hypothetical protein